ncbi:MAG: hypothetical protein ACOYD1_07725 [Candidatus Nanopelagicales bacterium]
MAGARQAGMLDYPAVILAALWKEWLHPRSKDGGFIDKAGAALNVYADPTAGLNDPNAVRRRGKVVKLSENGVHIEYRDAEGNVVPPDPDAGFPEMVPITEFKDKVSRAPRPIARLDLDKESDDGR